MVAKQKLWFNQCNGNELLNLSFACTTCTFFIRVYRLSGFPPNIYLHACSQISFLSFLSFACTFALSISLGFSPRRFSPTRSLSSSWGLPPWSSRGFHLLFPLPLSLFVSLSISHCISRFTSISIIPPTLQFFPDIWFSV